MGVWVGDRGQDGYLDFHTAPELWQAAAVYELAPIKKKEEKKGERKEKKKRKKKKRRYDRLSVVHRRVGLFR